MDAENAGLDDGCESEAVKNVCTHLPNIRVTVFAEAFVVKAVGLGSLAGLVVATEHCNTVWIADFESDEEEESFEGVETAIDVVAHEEVVGLRRVATNKEQFTEVVELAVDIADDRHWGRDHLHGRLFSENFLGLLAEDLDFAFGRVLALAELFNELVKVGEPGHRLESGTVGT